MVFSPRHYLITDILSTCQNRKKLIAFVRIGGGDLVIRTTEIQINYFKYCECSYEVFVLFDVNRAALQIGSQWLPPPGPSSHGRTFSCCHCLHCHQPNGCGQSQSAGSSTFNFNMSVIMCSVLWWLIPTENWLEWQSLSCSLNLSIYLIYYNSYYLAL